MTQKINKNVMRPITVTLTLLGVVATAVWRVIWAVIAVTLILLILAACGRSNNNQPDPASMITAQSEDGTFFVSRFLWQAALDTLRFIPMEDLDPEAGYFVTEWYSDPAQPTNRLKVMVNFYGSSLRADALDVVVSRQVLQNNIWVTSPVKAATNFELEEAILTRARELRISMGN